MLERKYAGCSLMLCLLVCADGSSLFAATAKTPIKTQAIELGQWCSVTCPERFVVGSVAKLKVAYRGIDEETKLLCDLHYGKTDGSGGGFLANDWKGKPTVRGDGEHTFTIPIRAKDGLASVTILVFTSPDGTWQGRTRLVTSKPIAAFDPYPGYAKAKWNRSWIGFDYAPLTGKLVEGERIGVTVDYYLDPSEHFGTTSLVLQALGPRVPRPDRPNPTHLWYGQQQAEVKLGRGSHTFAFTIPKASPRNRLLLLSKFRDGRGKYWPWDTRAGAWYVRKGGFFELDSKQPGNLFTYDEPIRLFARLKNVRNAGGQKVLKYRVHDASGNDVARGETPFTVEKDGQTVAIELDFDRRGVFALTAEVDGWERRETTFARIPDVVGITDGKPTRFGMTTHVAYWLGIRTEEVFQVARKLGITTCRQFFEWQFYQPGPDLYRLRHWDNSIEMARKHGLDMVLCVYRPPAWALKEGKYVGYRMIDLTDWGAWTDMIKTVTERYKGRIWGWEWLNEITPGGTPDYVKDYAKLCEIGTATARAVDSDLHFVLAGGLWPRSFRLDVLNVGTGRHVDVLPIHYGNGSGVCEAREDLASFGCSEVKVWDNETGRSVLNWDQPAVKQIADTVQPNWVLTQWTDELVADCSRIIYFGGEGSATGNFDYVMDDLTPRPVAATLAVFTSKLFQARGVGVFGLGKGAVFHLFERSGEAVLVASTYEDQGEQVELATGSRTVLVTDYQGNEHKHSTQEGLAALPLAPLRCFVEGADLDVVKAYLVPTIQVHGAGGKREKLVTTPTLSLLKGRPGTVNVRLRNLYTRTLSGTLSFDTLPAWLATNDLPFALRPGEDKLVPIPTSVPNDAEANLYRQELTVRFAWEKLPVVMKPFNVSVLSPDSIGNLLRNGNFEQAEADGSEPAHWGGSGARLASAEDLGLGLGKHVLEFPRSTGWQHYGQTVDLRGGVTYLYTAWVWNKGVVGGSNLNQYFKDGSSKSLYNNAVINIGDSTKHWKLFTCRYKAPEGLVRAGFVPVAKGAGTALYDNIRVTLFEGTDYAIEAHETEQRPVIDGRLDDWARTCPLPLIGSNQLTVLSDAYEWTPRNLNAVAYLAWDADNLYVAVEAMDDRHHATGNGEGVVNGDSLILAFDPTNRSPEALKRAFAYYVSSARPGGGSGVNTLFRPQQHSAGLRTGHLARDSSVYELATTHADGRTTYELRMPFSELGVQPVFGGKFAFSIQLNDNDGGGLAAHMNWGGGLAPVWRPANFGLVTFVE